MVIYLIHNKLNGKYYVGKTKHTLGKRWSNHTSEARRGSTYHLHRAIRKYGEEHFSIHPLMVLSDPTEAANYETFLIALFKARDPQYGYNTTPGGEGFVGKKSAEHIRKIADAKRGTPLSEEHRAKLSVIHRGRKHSVIHAQRIAAAQMGKRGHFTGHQHSEETKQKMREARLRHLAELERGK